MAMRDIELTGARLTTFLRQGRNLSDGRARPFTYPEPKFVRMATTITYVPDANGWAHSPGAARFTRSIAPINVARVKWLEG